MLFAVRRRLISGTSIGAARRLCTIRMPHETLGVAPDANHDDVKRAFKALALRLHPDIPGSGNQKRYLEAQLAMEAMLRSRPASFGPKWQAECEAEARAKEEAREWEELRRDRERRREDETVTNADRKRSARLLKLVILYVLLGAVVKIAAVKLVMATRESGERTVSTRHTDGHQAVRVADPDRKLAQRPQSGKGET